MASKVTALKSGPVTNPIKVIIKEPNFQTAKVKIVGTAPYMQNAFSSANRDAMLAKQQAGSAAGRTRRAKPPKDFEKVYEGSIHYSQEGWIGIPATALRNAMIEACRLTEIDMTRAKMCVFVVADGLDRNNLEPLIKVDGTPKMHIERVKIGMNQTDLAARAVFAQWSATFRITWDADVFQAQDVINLLARAGRQVGIGAGRPLSKTSAGRGMGTWSVQGLIDTA